MADRDTAAVDVEFVRIDAQLVAAIERLARERLVDFPEADVVDLEARAVEQFGNGKDRTNAHFLGLAARDLEAAIDAEDRDTFLLGHRAVHHHLRRGAVRKLACIARGDMATFLDDEPVFEHGFERGEFFGGGIAAHALVMRQRDRFLAGLVPFLVEQRLADGDRDDLFSEPARGLRRARALLADRRELVLRLAADAITVGDDLGSLDHRHIGVGIGGLDEFRAVAKLRRMPV